MTLPGPLLPGTFNSRYLGGVPASGGVVRAGVLARSDAPVRLGEQGRAVVKELGIRTALDLREPVERELDPADLDGLGIELRRQSIIGEDFQLAKEMTLEQVYRQLLEHRGPNLTDAVRALADADVLPALIFCSAGKDRTGLVTALLLGALGVADEDIVADYARSEQNMNGAFRAAIEARAVAAGISEQELAVKVGAPPALMRESLAWLREHHGGAVGHLRNNGLAQAELEAVRRGLVEPLGRRLDQPLRRKRSLAT
jgi:protein-tyrosine phosphatase